MSKFFRYTSFVLAFVFLFSLSVSASASDSQFVDIYDFGGIVSSSNGSVSGDWRFSVVDDTTISIALPENQTPVFYVDFLIYGASGDVSFFIGSSELNVVSFGYGLFRVFGDITYWNSNDLLPLRIVKSGSSWFNIVSAKVSYFRYSPFELSPEYTLNWPGGSHSWTTSGDGENAFTFYASDIGDYQFWIDIDDWQAYDIISLDFVCLVSSINSIIVTSGTEAIPFEVDFIESNSTYPPSTFIFSISIDLSNVYRVDDILSVCISGTLLSDDYYMVRSVNSYGVVFQDTVDPELTWFERLVNAIESWGQRIVDAILGNPDDTSDSPVDDSLKDQADEIQDYLDSFEQVERPDLDDVELDVSNLGNPLTLENFLDWLYYIFDQTVFYNQILISSVFMLSSYVLFGKRR